MKKKKKLFVMNKNWWTFKNSWDLQAPICVFSRNCYHLAGYLSQVKSCVCFMISPCRPKMCINAAFDQCTPAVRM